MPENKREQTEMRQSQATLPSPQEGAAAMEGRALWQRGDPMGDSHPSTRVGRPFPTVPHPDWGPPGEVGDLA